MLLLSRQKRQKLFHCSNTGNYFKQKEICNFKREHQGMAFVILEAILFLLFCTNLKTKKWILSSKNNS